MDRDDSLVIGCGTMEKGDILGRPAMKEAYQMGYGMD